MFPPEVPTSCFHATEHSRARISLDRFDESHRDGFAVQPNNGGAWSAGRPRGVCDEAAIAALPLTLEFTDEVFALYES